MKAVSNKENNENQRKTPINQERVEWLLKPMAAFLKGDGPAVSWERLYIGFDIGTTNLVAVALNEKCEPVSAALKSSCSAVRDGVVVDYVAALKGMESCLELLKKRIGKETLDGYAATAYPPNISVRTAKVFATIVESLGFDCDGLYEEPTAAAEALGIIDGAVVDIGGGTTGITVLRNGNIVYSADEPTGGTHMTLVIAGGMGIEIEEAEKLKRDVEKQPVLMPMVQPVLEKMGIIVKDHLKKSGYYGSVPVVVAGGGADLPGASDILSKTVGYLVNMTPFPMLVTPAGIAVRLWREKNAGRIQ